MANDFIEIESFIFDALLTQLENTYPGISVYSATPRKPASFPSVTIEQIDDSTILSRATSESIDNASRITFEINVYSNVAGGAKMQCKEIMANISIWLADLGFVRTFNSPTPLVDATISRRTARFVTNVTQTVSTVSGETDYHYYTYAQ